MSRDRLQHAHDLKAAVSVDRCEPRNERYLQGEQVHISITDCVVFLEEGF